MINGLEYFLCHKNLGKMQTYKKGNPQVKNLKINNLSKLTINT